MAKTISVQPSDISEKYKAKPVTDEDLYGEYTYLVAERILKQMLEKGLIDQAEYRMIDDRNLKSFSPRIASLLAKIR